jgi:hypothetical protein
MGDASLNPIERIWQLIGMPAPNLGGGGRGGGGGGAFAAAFGGAPAAPTTANTGEYLVTMTVGGQTYRQSFRVERVSGGGDSGNPFGGGEEDAQAKAKAKSR